MSDAIEVFEVLQSWDEEREKALKAFSAGSDALRAYYTSRGCQRCFQEYEDLSPARKRNLATSRKALDDYLDPKTRRKDRYYCRRHSTELNAAVGCSGGVAGVTGHVCWAFTIHPSYHVSSRWFVGTYAAKIPDDVDTLKLEKTALTSYDEIQIDQPSKIFEAFGCNMQKNLKAKDGNYEEAMLRSMEISESMYCLIFNNCMDATHYILDGFGVESLPNPHGHTPYSYFGHILCSPVIPLHP